MGIVEQQELRSGGQGVPAASDGRRAGKDAREFNEPLALPLRLSPWPFCIVFFAVLAVLGLVSLAAHAQSAKTFFKRGEAAEAREDYDAAYENYQKAYAEGSQGSELPQGFLSRACFSSARI